MIGRRPSVWYQQPENLSWLPASEPAQTGFASRMGTRETIVSTNFHRGFNQCLSGTTCFSETGFNTRFQPMFSGKKTKVVQKAQIYRVETGFNSVSTNSQPVFSGPCNKISRVARLSKHPLCLKDQTVSGPSPIASELLATLATEQQVLR